MARTKEWHNGHLTTVHFKLWEGIEQWVYLIQKVLKQFTRDWGWGVNAEMTFDECPLGFSPASKDLDSLPKSFSLETFNSLYWYTSSNHLRLYPLISSPTNPIIQLMSTTESALCFKELKFFLGWLCHMKSRNFLLSVSSFLCWQAWRISWSIFFLPL